jgi:hypothetical protein
MMMCNMPFIRRAFEGFVLGRICFMNHQPMVCYETGRFEGSGVGNRTTEEPPKLIWIFSTFFSFSNPLVFSLDVTRVDTLLEAWIFIA